jgi:NADH-quinone oxidoreductase subunit J
MLTPLHIIFYLFSIAAIGSAVAVITARNPVRSVLSLVLTFFAMSGTWMLLRAEFLAIILLLVYVGAVMTLFLFVVMMLNVEQEAKRRGLMRYFPIGVALLLLMIGLIVVTLGPDTFGLLQMPAPAAEAVDYSNTQALGMLLFTKHVYEFEIAGVILLAAIIAAIVLAHRGPTRRQIQSVEEQVAVRPEDRLRIIKMAAEPKPKRGA